MKPKFAILLFVLTTFPVIAGLSVATSCELLNNTESTIEVFAENEETQVSLGQVAPGQRIVIRDWLWVRLKIEYAGDYFRYKTAKPPSACIYSSGWLLWYKRKFQAAFEKDGSLQLLGKCDLDSEDNKRPIARSLASEEKS